MGGLPRVDASSRPCAPLDLPRSPAGRAGSGRFTIGPRRMYLWSSSALCDQTRTCVGAWRRCVSMRRCRSGSERATDGRMAGARAKTRDGRRSDELLDPLLLMTLE